MDVEISVIPWFWLYSHEGYMREGLGKLHCFIWDATSVVAADCMHGGSETLWKWRPYCIGDRKIIQEPGDVCRGEIYVGSWTSLREMSIFQSPKLEWQYHLSPFIPDLKREVSLVLQGSSYYLVSYILTVPTLLPFGMLMCHYMLVVCNLLSSFYK